MTTNQQDTKTVRIVYVEDHPVARYGLSRLLDGTNFTVVAEAKDKKEGWQKVIEYQPDLLVTDIAMPHENDGVQLIVATKTKYPHIKCVAFTFLTTTHSIAAAFRAGASAYLSKNMGGEDLIKALSDVLSNNKILSPELIENFDESDLAELTAKVQTLTSRERTVLRTILINPDARQKEIADILSISLKTLETHVKNITKKVKLDRRRIIGQYPKWLAALNNLSESEVTDSDL